MLRSPRTPKPRIMGIVTMLRFIARGACADDKWAKRTPRDLRGIDAIDPCRTSGLRLPSRQIRLKVGLQRKSKVKNHSNHWGHRGDGLIAQISAKHRAEDLAAVANQVAREADRRVGALFASHLRAGSHKRDGDSADSGIRLGGNRARKRDGHIPHQDRGSMHARHRTGPGLTTAQGAAPLLYHFDRRRRERGSLNRCGNLPMPEARPRAPM